ncbi:MAG: ribbon-helix-helix domain-containing protein [Candidatus Bathyarchaeia archaeon]
MSKRTKLGKVDYRVTVRFPKRDIEFMERLVREGEYTNVAEVVRTSLKHFRAQWESRYETDEMKDDAFLTFKEDIEDITLKEWLVAHTSFMLPLHRYKGKISLHEDVLIFRGFDNKSSQKSEVIVVPLENIEDIHYGFDEIFRRTNDRGLGLFTEPLRMIYQEKRQKRTIYLYIGFDRFTRKSDNQKWFKTLSKRLMGFKNQ